MSMVEKLDNDSIDFAISTVPFKSGEYDWCPLFTDYILALISSNHPMSGKPTINLKDLSHERFAIFNADKSCLETTMQLCRNAGFTPDIIYNGNEISLIISLVASNICVFLCPSSNGVFGKDDPKTSPAKIAITQSICYPNKHISVGILTRKNKLLSPAATDFIDLIKSSYIGINQGFNSELLSDNSQSALLD